METLILTLVLLVAGTVLGGLGAGPLLFLAAVSAVVIGLCLWTAPSRKES